MLSSIFQPLIFLLGPSFERHRPNRRKNKNVLSFLVASSPYLRAILEDGTDFFSVQRLHGFLQVYHIHSTQKTELLNSNALEDGTRDVIVRTIIKSWVLSLVFLVSFWQVFVWLFVFVLFDGLDYLQVHYWLSFVGYLFPDGRE